MYRHRRCFRRVEFSIEGLNLKRSPQISKTCRSIYLCPPRLFNSLALCKSRATSESSSRTNSGEDGTEASRFFVSSLHPHPHGALASGAFGTPNWPISLMNPVVGIQNPEWVMQKRPEFKLFCRGPVAIEITVPVHTDLNEHLRHRQTTLLLHNHVKVRVVI